MRRDNPNASFPHRGPPVRPGPLDTLVRRIPWIVLCLGAAALLLVASVLNPANRTLWLLAAAFPGLSGLGFTVASLPRHRMSDNRIEGVDLLYGRDAKRFRHPGDTLSSNRVTSIGRGFTTGTMIEETTWSGTLDDLPPDVREHVQALLSRARPHPDNPDIRIAEDTVRRVYTDLDDMPPDLRRRVEDILEDRGR